MGATFAPKTMLALLVLGALNVLGVFGGDPVSVLSILKASKEAIESYDVERNMEIVHKHYFTTTKENNVFYRAILETWDEFKVKSNYEELAFIEKLLQKLKLHFYACLELPGGLKKAQCFFEVFELLRDLESGIRWEIVPKDQLRLDKTRLGQIYQSAGVLNAHLSIVAVSRFKYYDNNKIAEKRIRPFIHLMEKTNFNLKNYMTSMKQWLTDSISPANICWLSETLWQSFDKECETRWISTTEPREEVDKWKTEEERGDALNKRQDINNSTVTSDDSSRRQRVVVVPESPERKKEEAHHLKSFERDFLNVEERSISKIMDLFGGNKGKRVMRFRVQVTDLINDEVIYENTMDAFASSRGDVPNHLARKALEARSKAMRKRMDDKIGMMYRVGQLDELTRGILETTAAQIKSVYKR